MAAFKSLDTEICKVSDADANAAVATAADNDNDDTPFAADAGGAADAADAYAAYARTDDDVPADAYAPTVVAAADDDGAKGIHPKGKVQFLKLFKQSLTHSHPIILDMLHFFIMNEKNNIRDVAMFLSATFHPFARSERLGQDI